MKRFLFVVQGEGRGHMTQALAMKELIEETGNEVVCVMVGNDGKRKVPSFFIDVFGKEKIHQYFSPSFVMSKNQRVDALATFLSFVKNLKRCKNSINFIHKTIRESVPDVIINFYEPLYGLSRLFTNSNIRSIAIGHQYMFFYPGYFQNNRFPVEQFFGKIWSSMVGIKSEKIALSFYSVPNFDDITVLPPLLRKQLFDTVITNDNSVLAYAVNNGYVKKIVKSNPEYKRTVNCFCEKFWTDDGVYGNLILHELNGQKFLEYMGKCDTLLCTAGFESLCEAAYLGKKIVAVPTEGHFEQYFNALDAQKYGIAKYQKRFHIDDHVGSDLPTVDNTDIKMWIDSYKPLYKSLLDI